MFTGFLALAVLVSFCRRPMLTPVAGKDEGMPVDVSPATDLASEIALRIGDIATNRQRLVVHIEQFGDSPLANTTRGALEKLLERDPRFALSQRADGVTVPESPPLGAGYSEAIGMQIPTPSPDVTVQLSDTAAGVAVDALLHTGPARIERLFRLDPTPGRSTAEVFCMRSWGEGAPGVCLSLPPGWAYAPEKGADFDVHYFTSPAKACTISIHVGLHPSPRATREADKVIGRSEGTLLGRTAHWTDMKRMGSAGEFFFSEAIIEPAFAGTSQANDRVLPRLSLHVMISTATAEQANACKQALTTLDLQP